MEKQHNQIEKQKLSNIKHIILVASGKGGVGKSTIAASLALMLAKIGSKVGLLDADIYGPSVPTLFNIVDKKPIIQEFNGKSLLVPFVRHGVKLMSVGFLIDSAQPLIWRGPKASSGITQLINDTLWGNLDYLIIDTPPGTGDIHITLLQNFELSGVLVVSTPQHVALADVRKSITLYKDKMVGIPILGIVENMAWFSPSKHPDEQYFIFGQGGATLLAEEFSAPLLAQLPIDENICSKSDAGRLDDLISEPLFASRISKLAECVELQLGIIELKKKDEVLN